MSPLLPWQQKQPRKISGVSEWASSTLNFCLSLVSQDPVQCLCTHCTSKFLLNRFQHNVFSEVIRGEVTYGKNCISSSLAKSCYSWNSSRSSPRFDKIDHIKRGIDLLAVRAITQCNKDPQKSAVSKIIVDRSILSINFFFFYYTSISFLQFLSSFVPNMKDSDRMQYLCHRLSGHLFATVSNLPIAGEFQSYEYFSWFLVWSNNLGWHPVTTDSSKATNGKQYVPARKALQNLYVLSMHVYFKPRKLWLHFLSKDVLMNCCAR